MNVMNIDNIISPVFFIGFSSGFAPVTPNMDKETFLLGYDWILFNNGLVISEPIELN